MKTLIQIIHQLCDIWYDSEDIGNTFIFARCCTLCNLLSEYCEPQPESPFDAVTLKSMINLWWKESKSWFQLLERLVCYHQLLERLACYHLVHKFIVLSNSREGWPSPGSAPYHWLQVAGMTVWYLTNILLRTVQEWCFCSRILNLLRILRFLAQMTHRRRRDHRSRNFHPQKISPQNCLLHLIFIMPI